MRVQRLRAGVARAKASRASRGRRGAAPAACLFCDIVGRRTPASIVYEDDAIVGLMDINPVNPGHALVIPREHRPNLSDLGEELGRRLFLVTIRLEQALRRSGVRCEGIDLFLADSEAAGREFPHVHMHIIPRYRDDAFKVSAAWGHPTREELDGIAGRIRAAYARLWGRD